MPAPETLDRVREPARTTPPSAITNPNRIRALVGAFASGNQTQFNRPDGAGYEFLADFVLDLDRRNPQTAARLLVSFRSWRALEEGRRALAEKALRRDRRRRRTCPPTRATSSPGRWRRGASATARAPTLASSEGGRPDRRACSSRPQAVPTRSLRPRRKRRSDRRAAPRRPSARGSTRASGPQDAKLATTGRTFRRRTGPRPNRESRRRPVWIAPKSGRGRPGHRAERLHGERGRIGESRR